MTLSSSRPGATDSYDFVGGLLTDPFTQTSRSLAVAHSLAVVARLDLFAELTDGPVTVDDLATRRGVSADRLRMMFDVLAGEHLLSFGGGGYSIAPGARRWLDPDSPRSVTTILSHSLDYLGGRSGRDETGVHTTTSAPMRDDDSSGWLRLVRAQFEYARRIGDEVADAVNLPRQAQSVLDLGSAHGWYGAALCQRNPRLVSTVIDRAPAIAVGRELIWETGLEGVVRHQVGDIFTADLGEPHDAVICMPLLYGLGPDQMSSLLTRARAALQPGGLLITLRPHRVDSSLPDPNVATVELFLQLTSPADRSTPEQFRAQLTGAGFGSTRVHELETEPGLSVTVARAI